MARYDQQLAAGKTSAALATAMKAAQLGPPLLNAMPHWLLAAMTAGMANREPARRLHPLHRPGAPPCSTKGTRSPR